MVNTHSWLPLALTTLDIVLFVIAGAGLIGLALLTRKRKAALDAQIEAIQSRLADLPEGPERKRLSGRLRILQKKRFGGYGSKEQPPTDA